LGQTVVDAPSVFAAAHQTPSKFDWKDAMTIPSSSAERTLEIVGAGPAGLAANVVAARAGLRAIVHERRSNVGLRLHGDFQGLENWTTDMDVLDELASYGIEPSFEYVPIHEQVCFDPRGHEHLFRSNRPFYYLVRRGPGVGTLDQGLKDQVLQAGVDLRFNDSIEQLPQGGIVAQGPRAADVIAVGYVFETDAADGCFAVVDDRLAPEGYGYLLISRGRATLASCIFRDFHSEAEYLERTLSFFQQRVGFSLRSPRRFGGYGNAWPSHTWRNGRLLYAGESGGLQDALWGFGMRYAMLSGALAAKAFAGVGPEQYDELVQRRLYGLLRTSVVNRYLYATLGHFGYDFALQKLDRSKDARGWLRAQYAPKWWKTLAFPLARRSRRSKVQGIPARDGCDCTWCRCHRRQEIA
jgi:flavin-dependent dehydrogenase